MWGSEPEGAPGKRVNFPPVGQPTPRRSGTAGGCAAAGSAAAAGATPTAVPPAPPLGSGVGGAVGVALPSAALPPARSWPLRSAAGGRCKVRYYTPLLYLFPRLGLGPRKSHVGTEKSTRDSPQ